MIQEFVQRFDAKRTELRDGFKLDPPENYGDIVRRVVEIIGEGDYDAPDPSRIHEIDDGGYQGTLIFVVAGKGYQPSLYWYVKVSYGSCSVCDTFQAIRDYGDSCNDEQAAQYLTLALHIVQGMGAMQ